jgi:hypothetical protein
MRPVTLAVNAAESPLGPLPAAGETRQERLDNVKTGRLVASADFSAIAAGPRVGSNKLIYYEYYREIRDAIARETQPKKLASRKESCLD